MSAGVGLVVDVDRFEHGFIEELAGDAVGGVRVDPSAPLKEREDDLQPFAEGVYVLSGLLDESFGVGDLGLDEGLAHLEVFDGHSVGYIGVEQLLFLPI